MPRRKKLTEPQREPQGSDPGMADDVGVQFGDGMDALFDPAQLQLTPDALPYATVRVQWQDPASGRWMLHGYLDPQDASEAKIAELWGGGHYRCALVVPDDTGRRIVRKTVFIRLPGAHRMPAQVIQPRQWATAAATVATEEAPSVMQHSQRMSPNEIINTAMVQQLLDLVRQRQEARPHVDWGVVVPAVTGLVGTVLTAVLERSRDQGVGGMAAKIDALEAAIRDMRTGPTTHAVSDVARAMRELAELRDVLQPPTDGEGAMWQVALKALETLLARGSSVPVGPSPVPEAPERVREIPDMSGPRPPDEAVPLWQQLLVRHQGFVTAAVTQGMDPSLAAELVAELLPNHERGILIEFLRGGDCASRAEQVLPMLREFRGWTAQFWPILRGLMIASEGGEQGIEGEETAAE